MSRTTIYTKELAIEICAGDNLDQLSQLGEFPSKDTIYRWLRENKEFSDEYAIARAFRADARSDRIDDCKRKVLDGTITPDAARVVIDVEKWQAGKEAPKRYGEKIQAEHCGPDGKPLPAAQSNTIIVTSAELQHKSLDEITNIFTEKLKG